MDAKAVSHRTSLGSEEKELDAKVARKLQQNHTLFYYHTNDHKHGEKGMTAFEDEDINHFYNTFKGKSELGKQ